MALNEQKLAESLSARFGLSLSGCAVSAKDGVRYGIRAADIPSPNGFMIQIATGWKSIEASFVPDNYAGELIRAMGNSSQEARSLFHALTESFNELGNRITLAINGSLIPDTSMLPPAPWNKFDLSIRKLADMVTDDNEVLQRRVEDIGTACLALTLSLLPLEEAEDTVMPLFEGGLPEGACTTVTVNRYERSPVNRAACIAAHGAVCKVCGFEFGKIYGQLGQGYIEVHHKTPVSKMGGSYTVDPVKDLVPLCSNCHSMAHRTDPPLEMESLIAIASSCNAD